MDDNVTPPNTTGQNPQGTPNQSGSANVVPQQDSGQKAPITLEDLYGTSSAQSIQQNPQSNPPVAQQVPPVSPIAQTPQQPVMPVQPSVAVQPPAPEQPVQPVLPQQQPAAEPVQPIPSQPIPVQQEPAAQAPVQDPVPAAPQESAAPVVDTPAQPQPAPSTDQAVPSRRVLEEEATKVSQTSLPADQGSTTKENVEGHKPGGFSVSKMLRYAVGAVVLLVVILIIWGIGSMLFSGGGNQSGKVTLTYWGLWEDAVVLQPIFDDFQKQHPDITITYSRQDPKNYTKRLLTRAQDGTGPDIFRFHNTWVYPLQGLLLPLPTQVISKQDLDTNYPPVIDHDLVQNGAVYGIPLQMDTLALYVNTDILSHAGASVPTSWDSFITVAKALTVKDPTGKIKTAGAAIGTYDNIAHAPDVVSLLLAQNGANLNKLSPSQNANDALTFYTSFASPDSSVWDGTLDNSLQAFARGKVAMYFGYSFDTFSIRAIAPTLKFATYPVPHLPGRTQTIASYWVEGVSSRSKHQKQAFEFMQYLAQKDVQAKIYTEEAKTRSFGELYARTDLAEGLKANSLLKPFIDQYPNATSSFFSADTNYDEYNGALNQYLGNSINSMVQGTSVDSALQTVSQGVSQVMSTYAPKTP